MNYSKLRSMNRLKIYEKPSRIKEVINRLPLESGDTPFDILSKLSKKFNLNVYPPGAYFCVEHEADKIAKK